ncbi:MAG: NUDIX hydrolase [Flavobacterium sp.]|nr:NUDIX hydrolase [Flavobacterium sp.]PZO33743.1 MAG: DNA mismatch repair protein MutT [Flavobacteriaceae bacterium]
MKHSIYQFPKDIIASLIKTANNDGIQKLVVGALIIKESKVLLLRRCENEFLPGLIELPSGGIDAGEEIIDALIREVKEETGLSVISVDGYISAFDYFSSSGKKARQLNFTVTAKESEVVLNPKEHDLYIWLLLSDVEKTALNISTNTKEIIESFYKLRT